MKKWLFSLSFILLVCLLLPTINSTLQEKKDFILSNSTYSTDYLKDLWILQKSPLNGSLEKKEFSDEFYPHFSYYNDFYYGENKLEMFGIGAFITPRQIRELGSGSLHEGLEVIEYKGKTAYYAFNQDYYHYSQTQNENYNYQQLILQNFHTTYNIVYIKKSNDTKEVALKKLLEYLEKHVAPFGDI